MPDIASNNKHIAKNTLFLYFRTFLLMCISLYTSRVLLNVLGFDDFGIYNIVGGVIVLFSFINGSMTSATQRHLSYELGKKEGNVSEVYSSCIVVHCLLAFVVFILAETIGLWFLNTEMNFPENRMTAVNWVYQFSVIACLLSISRVPITAAVVAYEHFSFYAYLGIIEAILKLLVVYVLACIAIDKLILYSCLILIVTIITTLLQYCYVKIHFKDIAFYLVRNKTVYKRILSFSFWTIFGSFANMGRQQGVSIVVNIFYGVAVNAAIGIANQVLGAVNTFVSGFQQAVNPQLIKSEAGLERQRQFSLITRTSKFSFFIMLIPSIPVILYLDFILKIWLGVYPEHTVEICRWVIIATLAEAISGPLWMTIFATGKLRNYQIVISLFILLNVPLACLCGWMGLMPHSIYALSFIINMGAIFIRLYFLHKLVDLNILRYITRVFLPIIVVMGIFALSIYLLNDLLGSVTNFPIFLFNSLLLMVYSFILIYIFGLSKNERDSIKVYVVKYTQKVL